MRTLALLLFAGLGLARTDAGWGGPPSPPDPIVGVWSFNADESDNPREVLQRLVRNGDARAGRGPAEGGRRGGGMGAGGRRPPEGFGGRNPADSGGFARGPMALVMQPVHELSIQPVDSSFSITSDNQPSLLLYTDGKKWTQTVPGEGAVEFSVDYKRGELKVERKFEEGTTLRETYKYDEKHDRLKVNVRLSGGRLPRALALKRIYDRDEPSS